MPTKRGRRLIYARPSFLEGMARIFDLGGTLNEYGFAPADRERDAASADGRKADDDGRERDIAADGQERDAGFWDDVNEAMRSDWQAVGDDLRAAMGYWRKPDCPACDAERAPDAEDASADWEGLLPSPDTLRQYEEIMPGSAERIMRMAEEQARHRMQTENRRLEIEKRRHAN